MKFTLTLKVDLSNLDEVYAAVQKLIYLKEAMSKYDDIEITTVDTSATE